jgi:hypothetical protein
MTWSAPTGLAGVQLVGADLMGPPLGAYLFVLAAGFPFGGGLVGTPAKVYLPRAEAWVREMAPVIAARLGQPG